MSNRSYPIVIKELSEEDGGGFVAIAPDLYGCKSDGETREEASVNVQEAICEWCDEMIRLGRDVPEPGSAEKAAQKAMSAISDALKHCARVIEESNAEISRLKATQSALHEELQKALEFADQQSSWAMLPIMHPRLQGTDLPH